MDTVHQVVDTIVNQPSSTWTTLFAYLAASTLVASILQIVKHKFKFADAQKLVVFMLGFVSFLVAFADFIITNNPALAALPWLGRVTPMLMGGAVVIHRFAVSPAYYSLASKLNSLNKALKEAELKQPEVPVNVAPAVPATVLPDEANLSQFQV